jgi:hypothetical protein
LQHAQHPCQRASQPFHTAMHSPQPTSTSRTSATTSVRPKVQAQKLVATPVTSASPTASKPTGTFTRAAWSSKPALREVVRVSRTLALAGCSLDLCMSRTIALRLGVREILRGRVVCSITTCRVVCQACGAACNTQRNGGEGKCSTTMLRMVPNVPVASPRLPTCSVASSKNLFPRYLRATAITCHPTSSHHNTTQQHHSRYLQCTPNPLQEYAGIDCTDVTSRRRRYAPRRFRKRR